MAVDPANLRVFVSSTSEDLKPYRSVARLAILKIGWVPIMMEDFGAMPEPTVAACRDKLQTCQAVLLIQAFRCGWVPSVAQGGNGADSITALELAGARESQPSIPVLAMLASESWPGNQWEREAPRREWVEGFRNGLNLPAEFFDSESTDGPEDRRMPAFRAKVLNALGAHRQRLVERQVAVAGAGGRIDFFEGARGALTSGRGVPFIGAGIFGNGPLGIAALTNALLQETPPEPGICLATVAEYRERLLGDRALFLNELRAVIERQSRQAPPSPVIEMLLALPRPALVVASSYDQMLERALAARQRKYAVVSHIVHSYNGEFDGKILVVRPGEPVAISLADRVEIRDGELVIYRPLGSPLLHADLDPDLEIDTVVVTESDHLNFLGRLENKNTQIPTAFSRPLQSRPLVFVGYGLDVWHFRLVMQVFQVVGVGPKHAPIIAVRKPASPMEELAWSRLSAGVVLADPEEFARRVTAVQAQPA